MWPAPGAKQTKAENLNKWVASAAARLHLQDIGRVELLTQNRCRVKDYLGSLD